jgi:hypothetical protein
VIDQNAHRATPGVQTRTQLAPAPAGSAARGVGFARLSGSMFGCPVVRLSAVRLCPVLCSVVRLSGSMSGCPVLCPAVRFYVRLSGSMPGCPVLCPAVRFYVRLSGSMSGCPVLCPAVRFYVRLSGSMSGCPVLCPAVRLYVRLSGYMFGCPVICPAVRLSGYMFGCPAVRHACGSDTGHVSGVQRTQRYPLAAPLAGVIGRNAHRAPPRVQTRTQLPPAPAGSAARGVRFHHQECVRICCGVHHGKNTKERPLHALPYGCFVSI